MALIVTTDVTEIINAPIGQVWAIVTSFGAESLWFPGVISSSLEGYGVGSVRTITFEKSKWVNHVREVMEICDPIRNLLRFRVYNVDVPDDFEIHSNIILEDVDGKSTKFRWFGETQRMSDPAEQASIKADVEAMYRRCAKAIGAKLALKA